MTEPLARRTIFSGLRQAAIDLWGKDGLAACAARLSEEARAHCIDPVAIKEGMLPERYVLEWYAAAWEGPAQRNRQIYNRWLQRMMDFGFGKVRKLLLSFAKPEQVVKSCPMLWRHDHSHGVMSYQISPKGNEVIALVTLSDHPYVEAPLSRASISEIYRYAAALASTDVRASHRMASATMLEVQLSWEPRARASAPTH